MREETLILTLFAFIGLVDPHAAMGAAFGCMFYLSVPKEENDPEGGGHGMADGRGEHDSPEGEALYQERVFSTYMSIKHVNTYDVPSIYQAHEEESGKQEYSVHELKGASRATGFVQEPSKLA